MKKQRILTLSCLFFSVIFILSACSNSQTANKTSESTSQTVQVKVNERYQNALSYLESGENKQAYDELNKIKNIKQAPTHVRALKADLALLLAAKKAVTAAKLTETEKYLGQLEKVESPTALVKQVNELEKEYQAVKLAKHYAAEVEQYYQAGAYQAAGGSLQALDSLSSKYQAVAMLQEKEAGYKAKIASAQATASSEQRSTATSASEVTASSNVTPKAGYTNARSSKLLSSEYKKETGSEIASAPSEAVSSMSAKMSNQDVLSAFRKATAIPQEAGDQYYVQDLGNDHYQIEIRHTSPSDPQVSNLKGMYRFDLASGASQKLNEVSGQYEKLN